MIDFLSVILDVEGEISLSEFKSRVRDAFELTNEDLKISTTRPGECMYEQRCRNLKSHENFPNNMIEYKDQVFRAK